MILNDRSGRLHARRNSFIIEQALGGLKATGINVETLVLVSGALMTVTAFFGFKALTILSFVAVPSIIVLGGYSVSEAMNSAGGLQGLMAIEPSSTLGYAAAISICVGSFLLADYLLVRKGFYPAFESSRFDSVNPSAMIAWMVGIMAASFLPGIAPINGVLAAAACHVILQKAPIFQARNLNHAP